MQLCRVSDRGYWLVSVNKGLNRRNHPTPAETTRALTRFSVELRGGAIDESLYESVASDFIAGAPPMLHQSDRTTTSSQISRMMGTRCLWFFYDRRILQNYFFIVGWDLTHLTELNTFSNIKMAELQNHVSSLWYSKCQLLSYFSEEKQPNL